MPPKNSKRPTDSTSTAVAASTDWLKSRSDNRLSGKAASDALKQGNNAGMLFKKEVKAASNVAEHRQALEHLRMAEKAPNGDSLRQWAPR
jgi:hypothetical protein